MEDPEEIESLLAAYQHGDRKAFDRLVPLVYRELRAVARGQRREGLQARMDTTSIVHEAYLKMAGQSGLALQDRGHLVAVWARAMRQVVISRAREAGAAKRGGGQVDIELVSDSIGVERDIERLIDIETVLERLEQRSERLARVVECRFFAGLSEEETASAMNISLRTAQRDWLRARAWIQHELGDAEKA